MGIFKEEASTFEKIERNQTRIYNDAADYGYPYNTSNPPLDVSIVIDAIKVFQKLDKQFPNEKNLVRNRQTWKGGVSVDVIIFWEKDEGYDIGTKYTISFSKTGNEYSKLDKDSNAFISIDIERYSEKS